MATNHKITTDGFIHLFHEIACTVYTSKMFYLRRLFIFNFKDCTSTLLSVVSCKKEESRWETWRLVCLFVCYKSVHIFFLDILTLHARLHQPFKLCGNFFVSEQTEKISNGSNTSFLFAFLLASSPLFSHG